MSKLFLLALFAAVGLALAQQQVCVPTPNWMEVQLWSNTQLAYANQLQYLDVSADSYRATDVAVGGHGHDAIVQDVLVLAAQSKIYITDGNPNDPKSYRCRVINQSGTVKDPCLSYNATKVSTDMVGTEKVDQYFTQDSHGGVPVFGRLLFLQTGVPVSFVQWTSFDHTEQLFLNFNQTLPADAFAIPSICNQAETATLSPSELLKTYRLTGKFEPKH
jgi:hypothetical protein